jgi:hypothetical protein
MDMKKLSYAIKLLVILILFGCTNATSGDNENISNVNGPGIEFNKTEYDFGKIPYQGNAMYEFKFKNTGNEPLVLNNVKSTCGCTVPDWPKEPIGPGETAKIQVKYNTRITGSFAKGITVYSNADQPTVQLRIKGEVEKPAANNM